MKWLAWGVLALSAFGLLYQLAANRKFGQVAARFGLQLVFGAFLLYMLNVTSGYTGFTLPINLVTLGTVGVLGLPGVALLVGLDWIVL
ncbi:pro-sigmaK processing inhibitor BofA family protein [Paenibacillus sp. N1-5-1-14]|uniref:pro-sigmaK processing inhibitor BofA family protein n=1 Tax=Paenibacillus radicibacter TaxID=2972488 RepID=UPI0021594841|nr:pro-sigmaK processing inhibitor BofA family protein [Paenibacillus radicibacter]MCR8642554.1 pro-sigmaK processing inhibitor BofA family protein [Paenibacillus radicibacter]